MATVEPTVYPTIAGQIERLQNAKTALKTAIENKGIIVPSSTKLDDYADLVDSIEAGGGDMTSMLTKENLISVDYLQYQPFEVVSFNKDNNFYIENTADVLGRLYFVSFNFKDITISWNIPLRQGETDLTSGIYVQHSQDGSTKYKIINISDVSFYVSRDYSNAIIKFYLNDDVVATYQYLD